MQDFPLSHNRVFNLLIIRMTKKNTSFKNMNNSKFSHVFKTGHQHKKKISKF